MGGRGAGRRVAPVIRRQTHVRPTPGIWRRGDWMDRGVRRAPWIGPALPQGVRRPARWRKQSAARRRAATTPRVARSGPSQAAGTCPTDRRPYSVRRGRPSDLTGAGNPDRPRPGRPVAIRSVGAGLRKDPGGSAARVAKGRAKPAVGWPTPDQQRLGWSTQWATPRPGDGPAGDRVRRTLRAGIAAVVAGTRSPGADGGHHTSSGCSVRCRPLPHGVGPLAER